MSDRNSENAHEMESRTVAVITSDQQRFCVPIDIMRQSGVFNQMYESSLFDSSSEFNVSQVNGRVFERVLEWCRHREGKPEPAVEVDPHTRERRWFNFSEFERNFLKVPIEELEELVTAANFLNIQSLYLFACQATAALLKNKSPEEIRSLLGLPDDLTEEEKESIRRENVWCSHQ
ncbi:Skp1-related protein [Aphelenchoides besseyi]|nr:Skp1-related protein [Aphelenchoides besseyi]KAI6202093.1 Skp1-related protein [Aphelenchoides besseyi]